MKKIKVGDIFEITTPQGNAYLHYIFKDSEIGELIRVLPGLYSERPSNLDLVAGAKESYLIFFPLTAAHKKKIVEMVGSYSSEIFDRPKYMRTEHIVKGEFLGWHIIETSTWQRKLVKKLDLAQKQMSPWGVWNDTFLVEKLVNNWTLEKWI